MVGDSWPNFLVASPGDWGAQPIVQFAAGLEIVQGTIVVSGWSGVTGVVLIDNEIIPSDGGGPPVVVSKPYVSDLPGKGYHVATTAQTLGATEPTIDESTDQLHFSLGPQ